MKAFSIVLAIFVCLLNLIAFGLEWDHLNARVPYSPQDTMVRGMMIDRDTDLGDWGIAHQECDAVGDCVLLIYQDGGDEGFTWTVYATCTDTKCQLRTSTCASN